MSEYVRIKRIKLEKGKKLVSWSWGTFERVLKRNDPFINQPPCWQVRITKTMDELGIHNGTDCHDTVK